MLTSKWGGGGLFIVLTHKGVSEGRRGTRASAQVTHAGGVQIVRMVARMIRVSGVQMIRVTVRMIW